MGEYKISQSTLGMTEIVLVVIEVACTLKPVRSREGAWYSASRIREGSRHSSDKREDMKKPWVGKKGEI